MMKHLPRFISHFLGYRDMNYKPKVILPWRIYLWSFLASWIGIALIEIIFTYTPNFQSHNTPMIIASFGAGAVLVYGVLESPLAQPRNVMCGQCIGSVVGVIIAQLFLFIQPYWPSESQKIAVQWVGGATAMALALFLMQVTKTVHPPGGATALIAVTSSSIVDISWLYIGIIMISVVIQVLVACLVNNIERRYPQYWWRPNIRVQNDPATISTLMQDVDSETNNLEKEEDITARNSNASFKSTIRNTSNHSSTTIDNNSSDEVDEAIRALKMYTTDSNLPYSLIVSGSPLIVTPNLLNVAELETLNYILCKINFNSNNEQH